MSNLSHYICDNIIKNYGEYIGKYLYKDLISMCKCDWLEKGDVNYVAKLIYQKQDLSAFKSLTKVTATSIVLESIPSVVEHYSFCGCGLISNLYTKETGSLTAIKERSRDLTVLLDIKDYINNDFDVSYADRLADVILSGLYDDDITYLTSLWMAYKLAKYKRSL